MKFELKKVKCYPRLSQETEAFSAQLWVDGKHIADVSNNGEGGSHTYHPVMPFTWKDTQNFETMQMDYEISMKVIEMDEVRKKQTKGFYLKGKDGNYYVSKFKQPLATLKKYGNYTTWVTETVKGFESMGYEVLNTNL